MKYPTLVIADDFLSPLCTNLRTLLIISDSFVCWHTLQCTSQSTITSYVLDFLHGSLAARERYGETLQNSQRPNLDEANLVDFLCEEISRAKERW